MLLRKYFTVVAAPGRAHAPPAGRTKQLNHWLISLFSADAADIAEAKTA
jgi:hypothetical protein